MNCTVDYTLCRLCLCSGGRLMDIFEEINTRDFMVEKTIEDLLQLKVTKESAYPWLLCPSCLEKLTEFRLFKLRCLECLFVFDNRVIKGNLPKARDWESGQVKKRIKVEDGYDNVPNDNGIQTTAADTHEGPISDDGMPSTAWKNSSSMETVVASDLIPEDESKVLITEDPRIEAPTLEGTVTGVTVKVKPSDLDAPMENDFPSCGDDFEDAAENLPEDHGSELEVHIKEEAGHLGETLIVPDMGEELCKEESIDLDELDCSSFKDSAAEVDVYLPVETSLNAIGEESIEVQSPGHQASSLSMPTRLCSHSGKNESIVPVQVGTSDSKKQDSVANERPNQITVCEGKIVESSEEIESGFIDNGGNAGKVGQKDNADNPYVAISKHVGTSPQTLSFSNELKGNSCKKVQNGGVVRLRGLLRTTGESENKLLHLGKGSTVASNLNNGLGGDRRKLDDGNPCQFCCNDCGKKFSSNAELNNHKSSHHALNIYVCPQCGKSFTCRSRLKKHMYAAHLGVKRELPSKEVSSTNNDLQKDTAAHREDTPHLCTQCSKVYPNASSLKSHMLVHTGEKPYGCNVCTKSFRSKSSLRKHVAGHTGQQKAYSCTKCSKKYCSSSNLKRHMYVHTGEKRYFCSLCSKSFSDGSGHKKHMKKHTEVSSDQCSLSPKSSDAPGGHQTEMYVKAEDGKYSCSSCPRKFYRERSLQMHMLFHLDNRPFSCGTCSRRFKRKLQLKNHMALHTGKKRYSCSVCSKEYFTKSSLLKHMATTKLPNHSRNPTTEVL